MTMPREWCDPSQLPELPVITMDHLWELIDSPVPDPVLYVDLKDGKPVLAVGPCAYTNIAVMLVARGDLLEEMNLSDEGPAGRITRQSVPPEEVESLGVFLEMEEEVCAAVGVLFM